MNWYINKKIGWTKSLWRCHFGLCGGIFPHFDYFYKQIHRLIAKIISRLIHHEINHEFRVQNELPLKQLQQENTAFSVWVILLFLFSHTFSTFSWSDLDTLTQYRTVILQCSISTNASVQNPNTSSTTVCRSQPIQTQWPYIHIKKPT